MNRFSHALCLTLCLLPALRVSAEDFQPMFNGEDFTGWVRTNTPSQTWRFEDDLLVCTGKPIGEIRTERMYENFIMELEWRHMVPKGNAGVFVWADDIPSRGVPFHRGIEVQVLENDYGNNRSHTTHGDIFPIHGATMTPINGRGGSRAFPTEFRSNPSPQWNHYRIECRDGEISLAVNGKVVTRGKACIPRKGYICLESEGGVVHYRNVRIKELPSDGVPPEQTAIADRGYESIYSGLDLEGWEAVDPDGETPAQNQWRANDWVLQFSGEANQRGTLQTTDTYAAERLVTDVRLKSDDSHAMVAIGDEIELQLSNDPTQSAISKALQPGGKWNRIEVVFDDGVYRVLLNESQVAEFQAKVESRPVRLTASGPVDFCNIFVATE